jgi:hypothetical protein
MKAPHYHAADEMLDWHRARAERLWQDGAKAEAEGHHDAAAHWRDMAKWHDARAEKVLSSIRGAHGASNSMEDVA